MEQVQLIGGNTGGNDLSETMRGLWKVDAR